MKVLRVIAIGFTVFWMVLIFRFSAETGIESHEISDQVTLLFCKVVHRFTGRDLVMSLTAHQYAVLEDGSYGNLLYAQLQYDAGTVYISAGDGVPDVSQSDLLCCLRMQR